MRASRYLSFRIPTATNIALMETVDGATIRSVSHSAVTNTATYDAYRREMVRTDGRGNATTNAYDMLGRLASVTDPLGATTSYAYDAVGNLVAVTNALGNATIYEYDLRGNKTYEGGATYSVRYTYDDYNVMTNMTTYRNESLQSGDTTTWLYDEPTGLLTNKVYADGKGYSCTYTVDGRLQSKTEASGRWKEFLYNAWGELANTIYSDGEIISTLRDVQGREVLETNNIASVLNVRDEFGYVSNEIITVGLESMALTRLYDDEGRELRLASSLYVGYDASGRYSILSNNEAIVQYAYNSDGSEAGYTISLSNGIVFARNVYRDNERPARITAISNCINGVLVENFDYTYDLLGRLVMRNSDTFGYNGRSEVVSSRRDEMHRRSSASEGRFGVAEPEGCASICENTEDGYAYDDIGNLLVSYVGANTNSYSANNLNQYTSILHASAPSSEDYLFYDLDGNLTNDSVFAYSYDAQNRLVSVLSNDVALLVNEYDFKSRRVMKVTPGATTTYFYDDWNLIEERIAYANGTTSIIKYYWGKDLSGSLQGAGGVGGLLYLTVDGAIYIPCYDNNGNITRYLDANGNTVAQYIYDPFGKLNAKSGSLADSFRHRFSTKYYDDETGLYYYGYRFYHPGLMRWLNRDPLEEEGGINLYTFCKNKVLLSVDILGATSIVTILDCFFDSSSQSSSLWIMPENDYYTTIVRSWAPVKNQVAIIKSQIARNPNKWALHHTTSPSWSPKKEYGFDPRSGYIELVKSPLGTDPITARDAYIHYLITGEQTDKLYTSAIGSFNIAATIDSISINDCKAVINIWMYNEMSRKSFGIYAKHWFFRDRPMNTQFMWWNWKETIFLHINGKFNSTL